MSREEFSSFLHTAEYRSSIRNELSKTNTIEEIIDIAKKYGFTINLEDFKKEYICEKTETWFKTSKIYPIKGHRKSIKY